MILEEFYVLSLGLAGVSILPQVVADFLAIAQGRATTDGQDGYEYIRTSIVRGDKAEAFVLSEKTSRNQLLPTVKIFGMTALLGGLKARP